MTPHRFSDAMAPVALKWRDLAERRRVHLIELWDSGRWKHYYTERNFVSAMRNAIADVELWSQLAERLADRPPAPQQ